VIKSATVVLFVIVFPLLPVCLCMCQLYARLAKLSTKRLITLGVLWALLSRS
jgi:hypothetical protein